jgi:hypothetical protein
MKRRTVMVLTLGAALLLAIIFLADRVSLASAAVSSERRPALLADARWNDPNSAQALYRRFPVGAPSGELVYWLRKNGFTIDLSGKHAQRRIQGLPCNELVKVSWREDQQARLAQLEATVSEAGCL